MEMRNLQPVIDVFEDLEEREYTLSLPASSRRKQAAMALAWLERECLKCVNSLPSCQREGTPLCEGCWIHYAKSALTILPIAALYQIARVHEAVGKNVPVQLLVTMVLPGGVTRGHVSASWVHTRPEPLPKPNVEGRWISASIDPEAAETYIVTWHPPEQPIRQLQAALDRFFPDGLSNDPYQTNRFRICYGNTSALEIYNAANEITDYLCRLWQDGVID